MIPARRASIAALLAVCSGAACSPKADLLVTHGMVWTGLSTGNPQPGGVAIRGGTILAVGDSASLARYVGRGTTVIDARGGLVAPGFADGHTHFIGGGFQLASIDLRDAATPQEFVRRIKDYAARLRPGEWILGGDWDHTLWRGAPLPRHDWIDSVTPNNPVWINRLDGHEGLANAVALKAAGITRDTPTPAGGEILRDHDGSPTGIFKDQAEGLIGRAIPDATPQQADSALARALRHAASLGVTATAHMSAGWDDLASYRRLERAGRMTLRVALYLPLQSWRAIAESIRTRGAGDDWVRIGGVKGYMDGSTGSRTAFFFEPYADSAGYRGLTQYPEDSMRRWIGAADSAGLQIAVHAIGDRANAILLDIYDSVAGVHGPRDRRFRDEHSQHLRPQDIARFGRIGVVASMQPYHAIDDLRVPLAPRHPRAPRLRLRLDRRAARPHPRHLRRCHPPHPRRQEPPRLGARAEDLGRRSAAGLYGGECVRGVRRGEARRPRARLLRGRGRRGPEPLHDAAGILEYGEGRGDHRGREGRVFQAVISRST